MNVPLKTKYSMLCSEYMAENMANNVGSDFISKIEIFFSGIQTFVSSKTWLPQF